MKIAPTEMNPDPTKNSRNLFENVKNNQKWRTYVELDGKSRPSTHY